MVVHISVSEPNHQKEFRYSKHLSKQIDFEEIILLAEARLQCLGD